MIQPPPNNAATTSGELVPMEEGRGRIRLPGALATVMEHRAAAVMIIILAVALTYWLWFGLTQRIFIEDEVISITAALSTLENGVPQRESGNLYHRGYVPNYLVAGSIGILGWNDFAIMLPSLLMGLGTLWLVYLLGKEVLGRPGVGVLAAALLVALGIETFYATSPRMYMSLQFFTTLALYCGWRGYVKGEMRFQLATFLAMSAAVLSHREGAVLILAIPPSILIVWWLTKSRIALQRPMQLIQNIVGVLFVTAVLWFTFVYSPETGSTFIMHGGMDPGWVSIGLDLDRVRGHLLQLHNALPYGLVLMPVAIAAGLLGAGRQGPHPGVMYVLLALAICALGVFVVIGHPQARFWFLILPVYALLVASALTTVLNSLGRRGTMNVRGSHQLGRGSVVLLLAVGVVFSPLLVGATRVDVSGNVREMAKQQYGGLLSYSFGQRVRPADLGDLLHPGFRLPCRDLRYRDHTPHKCSTAIKDHLESLRPWIRPEDVVTTTNPWVIPYYLDRAIQGQLTQTRTEEGEYGQFDPSETEGRDTLIIDSPDRLEALLKGEKRVWVIMDYKSSIGISQEMHDYMNRNYSPFRHDDMLTTYFNCLEPPCVPANGLVDEAMHLQ